MTRKKRLQVCTDLVENYQGATTKLLLGDMLVNLRIVAEKIGRGERMMNYSSKHGPRKHKTFASEEERKADRKKYLREYYLQNKNKK